MKLILLDKNKQSNLNDLNPKDNKIENKTPKKPSFLKKFLANRKIENLDEKNIVEENKNNKKEEEDKNQKITRSNLKNKLHDNMNIIDQNSNITDLMRDNSEFKCENKNEKNLISSNKKRNTFERQEIDYGYNIDKFANNFTKTKNHLNSGQELIVESKCRTNKTIKNSISSTQLNYANKRQTILNLFKVEKPTTMFFKKSSILLNKQIESKMSNKEDNSKENEKLDSNVLIDCLYPLIDVFDNMNFNIKRVKPVETDDLKKKILGKKVCYKQLSREDKKLYINSVMELKNKQKEQRQKKIEELKSVGKKYFSVKIINNYYGVNNLQFHFPLSNEEIEIINKCILNKWEFPPYEILEKFIHHGHTINKEGIQESRLGFSPYELKDTESSLNLQSANNHSKVRDNMIPVSNKNISHTKQNDENRNINKKEEGKDILLNNQTNLKNKIRNESQKIKSKNNLFGYNQNTNKALSIHKSTTENIVRMSSPAVTDTTAEYKNNNSKNVSWPRDLYMELINNNISQYENPKELLYRDFHSVNNWLNFEDFLSNFNNMIILHSSKFFNEIKEIDCNWYNSENDLYKSQDDSKVIFISTKNANMINLRNKEKEKNEIYFKRKIYNNNQNNEVIDNKFYNQNLDKNDFYYKTQNSMFNQNNVTFLIEYSTNLENKGYFKDFDFFVILDLYKLKKIENTISENNYDLILIKEDIILKGFYSTINITDLKEEEEYLLFIKGGLNPLGYHMKLLIDKGVFESMNLTKYLIKYENFVNVLNNFKVEIPQCLPNSPYLLFRLKALITTNKIRIKFDFNIKDVFLSQFFDLFLIRSTNENKFKDFKKIIFSNIITLEFENNINNDNNKNIKENLAKENPLYINEIYVSNFFELNYSILKFFILFFVFLLVYPYFKCSLLYT